MLGIEEQQADRRLSVRVLAAHEHPQQVAVVGVHGEIDLGTAARLREALLPVLHAGAGAVVLDLSNVAFMDSTGVHVLVDTLEHLSLETRRLTIACREGGQVHRVLGLVGLLDALTVYPSRETAVIGSDDKLRRGAGPRRGASTTHAERRPRRLRERG